MSEDIEWIEARGGGGRDLYIADDGTALAVKRHAYDGYQEPAPCDSAWFHLSVSDPGDPSRDEHERDSPAFRWVLWAYSENSTDHYGTDYLVAGESLTGQDACADVLSLAMLRVARLPPPGPGERRFWTAVARRLFLATGVEFTAEVCDGRASLEHRGKAKTYNFAIEESHWHLYGKDTPAEANLVFLVTQALRA